MLRILVIDDSPVHQQAARETLEGHELTIVGTYDEAHKLLYNPTPFDVVLTDLLMPAGKSEQGPTGMQYVGQEMPVGFALAMHAVLSGAKYVGVVTMTNHHNHPASAMLDRLGSSSLINSEIEKCRPKFVVNGAVVGYYQQPWYRLRGGVCPLCGGDGYDHYDNDTVSPEKDCGVSYGCGGTGNGGEVSKHWGKVLEVLQMGQATPT